MNRRIGAALLLIALSCAREEKTAPADAEPTSAGSRGAFKLHATPVSEQIDTDSIDWAESVGIFIGVERFRRGPGAPDDVAYAADDATDLADFFTSEMKLPRSRTVLLLAGRPHKGTSRAFLRDLASETKVIIEDENASPVIDAETVYAQIRELGRRVGQKGIVVISIATHGYAVGGQHILLTADASLNDPRGVVLARIIEELHLKRRGRLLLLVDACREQAGVSNASGRMTASFFEVKIPGGYAILSAAGPGGYARSSDLYRNGLFTHALLEGMRCKAAVDAAGFVTLSALDAYVSRTVRNLSGGSQKPEGRFGGDLSALTLVPCRAAQAEGDILAPRTGTIVGGSGIVEIRVARPELFATVLLCSDNGGSCTNQNPGCAPYPPDKELITRIPIEYGEADGYQLSVALSADPDLMSGEAKFPSLPINRSGTRTVYWLGPIRVISKGPRRMEVQ